MLHKNKQTQNKTNRWRKKNVLTVLCLIYHKNINLLKVGNRNKKRNYITVITPFVRSVFFWKINNEKKIGTIKFLQTFFAFVNEPVRPDLCALFIHIVSILFVCAKESSRLYNCYTRINFSQSLFRHTIRDNRHCFLCPMENLLFQMIFQFDIDMSSVYFLILFQSQFFVW